MNRTVTYNTSHDFPSLLLVGNDPWVARAVAPLLLQAGYTVDSAVDAITALSHLEQLQPDLLLIDLDSGPDIYELPRRILDTQDIPIVIISERTDAESVAEFRDIPHFGFFPKCAGESVLVESVRTALRLSASRDPDAGEDEVIVVANDKRERKESLNALRESEERFRSFFINDSAVKLQIDPASGVILQANIAAHEYYGYPNMDGMNIAEINTLSTETISSRMNEARVQHTNHFFFQHQLASGEIRNVEVYATPIVIEGRTILFSIIHDIEDKIRAEKGLVEAESNLRAIIENTDDAMVLCDRESRILICNSAFAEEVRRYFGVVASRGLSLLGLLRDEEELSRRQDIAAVVAGEKIRRQVSRTGVNGEERRFDIAYNPIINMGEVVGYTEMTRDITELYQVQQEYRRLAAERELLINETNHRVKNNLAMVNSLIRMKAAVLPGSIELDDVISRIQTIQLTHEKLYAGGRIAEVNLADFLTELAAACFSNYYAREVELESACEEIWIGSRQAVALGLIVNELATNAVKHGFTERTPARFALSLTRSPDEAALNLVIGNSGRPIPPEVEPHKAGSMGFRLISALTHQLGGEFRLERASEPRFIFSIPMP